MKPWAAFLRPRSAQVVRASRLQLSPPGALLAGFVVLIAIGTLLLKLPVAVEQPIGWLETLFTATSAVTVTGLVVVETGAAFTGFGQVVILLLIQLGGLGFMTFAVLAMLALGLRLGLHQRLLIHQAMNQARLVDVLRLVRTVTVFSLSVEVIGALLLSLHWVPELGWGKGLWYSVFYSVSAFNNAGFALHAGNLAGAVGDVAVNIVVSALFISGGLGFTVWAELRRERRFRHLSLHSKLMLSGTVLVNLVAMLALLLLEWGNSATLGGLADTGQRLLAAWFQAVTPRTAGFNTLDTAALTPASTLLTMGLMFIGGGPGSAASGIKLTTFIVLLFAVRAFLRHRQSPSIYHRSIEATVVFKALAVAVMGVLVVFVALLALTVTDSRIAFLDLAFEVVSAFGTVGLSRGVTDTLSSTGQMVLMFVMLLGRVGPLALGFMLATPHRPSIRYPFADVQIG